MFRHNNFARGLFLSIVVLTATMCLYNASRGDELKKKKKAKNYQYPTFLDHYLPTPLECGENLWLWCNKSFTLVPRLNPSLGFVTEQSSGNSENQNKNKQEAVTTACTRGFNIFAKFCCRQAKQTSAVNFSHL